MVKVNANSLARNKASTTVPGGAPNPTRLFLVDDHPLLREGLRSLLESQLQLRVCGEGERGREALEAIRQSRPDMVVLDLSLPDLNGIELIKSIRCWNTKILILVLSMHDETIYAERCLRAGAHGYVMKHATGHEILTAIRTVSEGEVYLSERMNKRYLKQLTGGKSPSQESSLDQLTDRELEVFQNLGEGLSTREIAEKLNLSIKTIESYRENLKQKFNVQKGSDLVRIAVQWAKSQVM